MRLMVSERHSMNALIRGMLVVLAMQVTQGISSRSNESLLIESLMSRYGPASTRPVSVQDKVSHVYMRYIISNVISLDEPNQKMTVSGWLKYAWVDEYLQWDVSETNVDRIRVDVNTIWHPDITLYNNVGTSEPVKSELFATVYPDGAVQWSSPAIFVTSCIMDVRYFPFDTQTCYLEFGSWSYEGHEVQLGIITGDEASQTEFAENGIWQLEDVIVDVHIRTTTGAYDYSTVKMYLILKRRYEFYMSNLMIPCVLLSCMSTLVYLLPPDCGEKVSYGMTLVLSLLVFQQLISNSLPPVADGSPILGYYFTFVITMGCMAMVVTSVVLNIYCGRTVKPPPRWAESIFLGKLGHYIGRYRATKSKNETQTDGHLHENGMNHTIETKLESTTSSNGELDIAGTIFNEGTSEMDEWEHYEDGRSKWEHISVVVDRLLFICSVTIVLIAAGIMIIMIHLH